MERAHMKSHHITIMALLVGLLLGAALTTGWSVMADGNPATDTVPRLLPYQGVLEMNGEPVNATGDDAIAVRFSLYVGPDAETPVYNQDARLEVFSGRFTTSMGPTGVDANGDPVAIADVIRGADDLHLGITLLGSEGDPSDDVVLTNRQRLTATPYAMWTTSATDLAVARNAIVNGDLVVRNHTETNTLRAQQSISAYQMEVDTEISALHLLIDSFIRADSVTTGSLSSGPTSVSTLTVTSDATVEGPVTFNGPYMRLPKRPSPPSACNDANLGRAYFDTSFSGSNYQLPCLCIRRNGGDYRWVPFDSWEATCN